jgi:ubiquinone/menaquinone biosynthesis C-methylase UbiE
MNEPFSLLKFNSDEGVHVLSNINQEFERIYLEVRDKEKRVYSDDELQNLPFTSESNSHRSEWNIRAKSFLRFRNFLQNKKQNLNILDLGCGNGWFSGQLSKSFNHNFYCVDINLTELKQGRRNFGSEKLNFIYADIFIAELPKSLFDIIIMSAAVQYFRNLNQLISRLLSLLTNTGEIHLIDSPIYSEVEIVNAKKRTQKYYSSLGFPEMSNHYCHHTWKELSDFKFKIFYDPNIFSAKFKKLFGVHDSPFPWIIISKQ